MKKKNKEGASRKFRRERGERAKNTKEQGARTPRGFGSLNKSFKPTCAVNACWALMHHFLYVCLWLDQNSDWTKSCLIKKSLHKLHKVWLKSWPYAVGLISTSSCFFFGLFTESRILNCWETQHSEMTTSFTCFTEGRWLLEPCQVLVKGPWRVHQQLI